MRFNADKKHFVKAERIFIRRLQENHIPFKVKVKINNREVDIIVGRYAIDIDGHPQDGKKNEMLAKVGYIPLHIYNREASTINISYLKK
jgi:hypothetical protein